MLKLINLKRYLLAGLIAGLTLGAQSAMAGGSQWYYEGHGWLTQPPFTSHSRLGTVIAGGENSSLPEFATESERPPFVVPDDGRAVTATKRAPMRLVVPAPYDTGRGYFN